MPGLSDKSDTLTLVPAWVHSYLLSRLWFFNRSPG